MPRRRAPRQAPARPPRRPRRARRSRVARQPRLLPNSAMPGLSGCAQEYAHALADPRRSPPCCIPDGRFPVPTSRVKFQCRTTFQHGAQVGYAVMNIGGMMMSDKTGITTTVTAYAPSTVPALAATSTLASSSDSTYTAAQFSGGPGGSQYRIVSAGLYVKSLNALQTVKGVAIAMSANTHTDLGGTTLAAVRLAAGEKEWPAAGITLDQEAIALSGPAVHPSELDFEKTGGGTSGTWTDTTVCGPLLVAVTGGSPGDQYDVEGYVIAEITGGGTDSTTPSSIDPIGTGVVAKASLNAVQNLDGNASARDPWPTAAHVIRQATSFLSENSGAIVRYAGTAAAMAASAYAAPEALAARATLVGGRMATKMIMHRRFGG